MKQRDLAKTKKALPLFFLMLLSNILTFAEKSIPERLDSAYQYSLKHPKDSLALNSLNTALNRMSSDYSDTVLYYVQEEVRLAKENNYPIIQGFGYNIWGYCIEISGDLDSAIVLYKKALELGLQQGHKRLLLSTYNNLGIVYSYKSLYQSSLEYTVKALAIADELGDTLRLGMMYNNIGLRYSELAYQKKAIAYFKKAIECNKIVKPQKLAINYVNLGGSYLVDKMIDSSQVYYLKALSISKEYQDEFNKLLAYSGLARCALEINQNEKALQYNDSSLEISTRIHDEMSIHIAEVTKGGIEINQNKYEEGIKRLLKVLPWFEEMNYFGNRQDILQALAKSYHDIGNDERAYYYMEKYAFGKDSTFNKQKDLAMEQVELYKEEKQEGEKEILNQQISLKEKDVLYQKGLRNTFITIGVLLILIVIGLANRYVYVKKTKNLLEEKNHQINKEKARSDELLLNILPSDVAEELKAKGESEAKDFDNVTVLFTDFVEFTQTSANLSAKELVKEINTCFKAFDDITTRYQLEKIKTIGDAYMAAGGLPVPTDESVKNTVLAALEMQNFINKRKAENDAANKPAFEMRVGIHTGPVVAGIVGIKKFQYDVWGDTVNTASRIENAGKAGKVNISNATYELLKDDQQFAFENRGKIEVKGKGEMKMWFVE